MKFRINHSRIKSEIDPDEIFLDSKNLPNFNVQQFEGRLETSISKRAVFFLGTFFAIITLVFMSKLGFLQIVHGESYFKKSENNTLSKQPIFAERGLIYDRADKLLAWNVWDDTNENRFEAPDRAYIPESGFGHLLGYVSAPAKDSSGNYWQDSFVGKDGVEKTYDSILHGVNGVRITETDVSGAVQSENIMTPAKAGDKLVLSIDAGVEKALYNSIASMAANVSFAGGAGVIMDVHTGEILALTSYPEYNPTILSKGQDTKTISAYLSDNRKVFLNRAVGGLYSPGSTVKPFLGYAALAENVISPFKNILANGSISIPNPYFPEKKSVFNDHGVFGYVDMKKAIAISSDVYFYEIGGGFQDQKGLGIVNISKYARMFGIAEKTGIDVGVEKEGTIPTPEWKAKTFNGDPWRIGDTYNTAIGQYGFQVTPVQMARAVAGIATDGVFPTPHVRLNDAAMEAKKTTLTVDDANMQIIREAMRDVVTGGTGTALNVGYVKVAAKSGTAQVGVGNTNTNSWIVGFYPIDAPKYAFAILMERGPKAASGNSTRVMAEVLDYMNANKPEYLK